MAGIFDHLVDHHAQRWLAGLMDQVGEAGLGAAAAVPALLAAVDQHAAGVRDILLLGVEGLAAAAAARFGGLKPPASPASDEAGDWLSDRACR